MHCVPTEIYRFEAEYYILFHNVSMLHCLKNMIFALLTYFIGYVAFFTPKSFHIPPFFIYKLLINKMSNSTPCNYIEYHKTLYNPLNMKIQYTLPYFFTKI